MNLKRYFGDKAFYRMVLSVSIPIMIQNGITNFVSLLDNVMVGRLGTESMSGVSIVNQFIFIFNLMVFGAVSAAGIFTAQYYGAKDVAGVRHTFRFKLLISLFSGVLGIAVFKLFDVPIISLFLHGADAEGDLALTLAEGRKYLSVMLAGLIPYAFSQAYASTMRETGETVVPMAASIVAVVTNFTLNLILIFGLLGVPALGVGGAAIATVVSRFAELFVLAVWGHGHLSKCPYLKDAYRSFRLPPELVGEISVRGLPLMLNEFFWSLAVTMRNQCYSLRNLDVVAAQNISSTISNVFCVVYLALGSAIALIVGNLLGAGELEKARDTSRKMMVFSIACSSGMAVLLIATAKLFPLVYNTTDTVRALATFMIIVSACEMPFGAVANASYFTIRSGGKVLLTMLFDSIFMWVVVMPIAYTLSHFTSIDIHFLFPICQATDLMKALLGIILLKKANWCQNLISGQNIDEKND